MPYDYINRYDNSKYCATTGYNAERNFEKWLINNHIQYRYATKLEQYNHIDFFIIVDGKEIPIDVKASKKVNRLDKNVDCSKLWVEFMNGDGGKGWLYGSSSYIVFEKIDENAFYWVDREELKNLCENICNKGIANGTYDALYKHYTRKGRRDDISQIMFDDIKNIRYVYIKLD